MPDRGSQPNQLGFRTLPQDAPYFAKWLTYRKRARLAALACALTPVAFMLLVFANTASWAGQVMLVGGITLLALVVFAVNYSAFWPCPRCGRPYHIDIGRVSSPFGRRCVHCGLSKWSPDGG